MIDMLQYEKELLAKGYRYIAGVDEVGRGPLAGPVTVCAVIMDLQQLVEGVNDSKKLSEKKRVFLYPLLQNAAIAYRIVMKEPKEIDQLNILKATILAMEEAVCTLQVTPDFVLTDAVNLNIPYPMRSIIKGDASSYSIAAASILAKVTRDRLMVKMDDIYPAYGFAKHKGYGTKQHIDAIREKGICDAHRLSFVKNFYSKEK